MHVCEVILTLTSRGLSPQGGRRGPAEEHNDMLTGGMIDTGSQRDAACSVCNTHLTDWRITSMEIKKGVLLDTGVRDEEG